MQKIPDIKYDVIDTLFAKYSLPVTDISIPCQRLQVLRVGMMNGIHSNILTTLLRACLSALSSFTVQSALTSKNVCSKYTELGAV